MSNNIKYCKCGCEKEVRNIWYQGHNSKMLGKTMSIDAREKIRQSKLGSKNPRFGKLGTCLGRKQTPEQIKKIKEARAKQVITTEHRISISRGLKKAYDMGIRKDIKEKKKFWNGGTLLETRKIRNSFEMRLWREAVFKRDNFTCQECKQRGGELNSHHIKPFSLFPELRLAIDNGVTLCKECHKKTDTYGGRLDLVKSNMCSIININNK